MTPKRKPVLLNHRGQPMKETDTAVFATIDGLVYEAVVGGKHHPRCACKRCHRAKKKPAPLPRAVRELLRDVVLWHRTEDDINPGSEDIANRAERILGAPWERIVERARKAGRR